MKTLIYEPKLIKLPPGNDGVSFGGDVKTKDGIFLAIKLQVGSKKN